MKILKVTLKQHTPLIHFQHSEEGATLRASEVKPKLDKFILKIIGNKNYDEGVKIAQTKGWLIKDDSDKAALNYKMEIIPKGEIQIWDINDPIVDSKTNSFVRNKKNQIKLRPYPAFFANMNTDYENPQEYKRFSYTDKDITMQIIFKSGTEELYHIFTANDAISDFFFSYNFGMRSSKGFGSFYPAPSDDLYFELCSKYHFSYATSQRNRKTFEMLFKEIDLFYKSLRGGINEIDRNGNKTFYFKSLIRTYCQAIWGMDWGKKKIQNSLLNETTEGQHYVEVKNLFGFSTNEEWKGDLYDNKKIKINIAVDDPKTGWRNPTEIENKDLPNRMQSPILIKPIYDEENGQYEIYLRFFPQRVNLKQFLGSQKLAVTPQGYRNPIILDLPANFKFADFFNYIFNDLNIDLEEYVEKEFHGHRYFKSLNRIYNELKQNI